jgi:phage baseplate assembly protein W
VFAPNSAATISSTVQTVRTALTKYEPRIDVLDINAEAQGEKPAADSHQLPHSREQRDRQHGVSVLRARSRMRPDAS